MSYLRFTKGNSLAIFQLGQEYSTHFKKQNRLLCTHRPIQPNRNESTWDSFHFDQIDYILTRNRWKNASRNCEMAVHAQIDSDHYPIWSKFKIEFKKNAQTKDGTQKELYNYQTKTKFRFLNRL